MRTVGRVEKRPAAEILQDLLTTSSDLIRVRAPSREARSGSLPREQAVAFVERSHDRHLRGRRQAGLLPDPQAGQGCGLPQPGSDGSNRAGQLRLDDPIPGRPDPGLTTELPLSEDMPDPFERQVTRTLAEGLAALELAARQAASSGGMNAFRKAVQLGVSANLCDAVAGLAAVSPAEGMEVQIAWSRARPRSNAAPSRVFLSSDIIPLIQEAARLVKSRPIVTP